MKANRGGRRGGNTAMPTAQSGQKSTYEEFLSMDSQEQANVINNAYQTRTPSNLDNSDLQKVVYSLKMTDKPTMVDEATFDSLKGQTIYRTVHSAGTITSKGIYNQIANDDYTQYSGSGGSAYGRGIYFADDLSESLCYRQPGVDNTVMRAKITGGQTISTSQLRTMYSNALRSGDPLATACSRAQSADRTMIYALAKGYSAVTDSGGYRMILNRGCLTMSSTAKHVPTTRNTANGKSIYQHSISWTDLKDKR